MQYLSAARLCFVHVKPWSTIRRVGLQEPYDIHTVLAIKAFLSATVVKQGPFWDNFQNSIFGPSYMVPFPVSDLPHLLKQRLLLNESISVFRRK